VLTGPFNKLDAKEDHNDSGKDDPIGWWRMHGDDALEINILLFAYCLRLLVPPQ
jgi:hypothetical protein